MTVILSDMGDEREVIDEERQKWLQRVLIAFGADKNIISKNTLEARRHVSSLNLDVETHSDGSIDIFRIKISSVMGNEDSLIETNRQLVGQWLEPKIIRIKEKPRDYYRITLNEWALPFQTG